MAGSPHLPPFSSVDSSSTSTCDALFFFPRNFDSTIVTDIGCNFYSLQPQPSGFPHSHRIDFNVLGTSTTTTSTPLIKESAGLSDAPLPFLSNPCLSSNSSGEPPNKSHYSVSSQLIPSLFNIQLSSFHLFQLLNRKLIE